MTFFFFSFFLSFQIFHNRSDVCSLLPAAEVAWPERLQRHQLVSVGEQHHTGVGGEGTLPGGPGMCGVALPVDAQLFAIERDFKKGKTSKDVAVSHALLFDPPPRPPPFRNRPSRRGLLAVPVIPAVFSQETVISFFFFFGNEWCSRAGMPVFPLSHGCLL